MNVHESDSGFVVALCDEDILGKVFSEGELILDIDSDFFGGGLATIEEIVGVVRKASSVNVVGNEIVGALLVSGILSSFKIVSGVKFAHVYRV